MNWNLKYLPEYYHLSKKRITDSETSTIIYYELWQAKDYDIDRFIDTF